MPVYEYKALDGKGREIQGIIDADSPRLARQKLRKRGIFPFEVILSPRAAPEQEGKAVGVLYGFGRRTSPKELAQVTRQLATLTGAGIPLTTSLNTILRGLENPRLKKILTQVREEVTGGRSFADALEGHPRLFSKLYTNMVRAGEASGSLPAILARLADLTENQVRLKNLIWSALAYPIFMSVVGTGILLFLLTSVVPVITRLFEEAHQVLPVPTMILISVSRLLQGYWIPMLLAGAAVLILIMQYVQSPAGRHRMDRVKLAVPLFGDLFRKLSITRMSRTLGTLLQSGIPLTTSLAIVRNVVDNSLTASHIDTAIDDINEGEDFATSLERSGFFPAVVIQMIAAGEQSGSLEQMLFKIADTYEEEVQTTVGALTSLVSPVLILVMGAIVGFIVISILLPILDMSRLIH